MVLGSTIGEAAWADCESLIRRFEDAWREQARPEISSFVPRDSPHATQVLVELVHIDLEFRLRADEMARVEDYLSRFPELSVPEFTLDLVSAEFALRNRLCPPAWPEEFWLRFPEHLPELQSRLRLDGGTGWFAATRPVERPGTPLAHPPSIAGYEILGELGRGGMGVVYKARDLLLHRTVAVKTFATVPRPDSCARFAREAEAIARLDHPNIVPVYEVGEWRLADGAFAVPFFVMKWYPGGSMDAAPAGKGTDMAAQARSVETIARAVHHAHQRGVLHRDLKPSNILFDDSARPNVADFGLAGRVDPDVQTITAVVAGTPAYMAPEQARNPKEVSTAADVYGLGAILYHQLAGRAPFVAETPLATLELVANAEPPRPSSINPAVPRDLDTICLKCLAKDPARRYATAAEVADDLQRWQCGLPIAARPVGIWEVAWRRLRRHPVISAMAAITFAALASAVGVLAVSNNRIREKEKETFLAFERECTMREKLQQTLDREQRALYLDRVALAGRLYAANQLTQAWELLDLCPENHRGWEWRYLDALRRRTAIALAGHTTTVLTMAFLPDGRLVSADAGGFVKTWDVESRKCQKTWRFASAAIRTLAVHPRRNWVAIADMDSVSVRDVDSGRTIARLKGANWAAFSPDGRRAVTADQTVLRLFAVPEGEMGTSGKKAGDDSPPAWTPIGELRGHTGMMLGGAFTTDGKQLITSSMDRSIRTWDLAGCKQIGSRSVPMPVADVALSADGKSLAEAHLGAVLFTNLSTGEARDRLEYPSGERTTVVSSPDRRTVAVSGVNGEVVVWDVDQRRTVRVFRGHPGRVRTLAFGGGNRLASAGGDEIIRVWDTTKQPEVRTLAWVGDGMGGLAVSPDGARVAVGPRFLGRGVEAKGLLLDAATGQQIREFPAGADVDFHIPSGRLVTGEPGGGISVRDPRTGNEVWGKPFSKEGEQCPTLSPGGRRLALTRDGTLLASWDVHAKGIRLFNPEDGREKGVIRAPDFIHAIDFSPDGRWLAVATSNEIRVWDVTTRMSVAWEEARPGAVAIAFSPDGAWLATIDTDRTIRLRDVATGRVARQFVGTALRVNAICFSPDGTRLVTGGADRTVRVWDVESGRELLSLTGATEGIKALAWDGANDRLYARDFAVRVWSISSNGE